MPAQPAVKPSPQSAYDALPYESFAYPYTHPSHLSTVATLFGLTPPDFRSARVLELGCASGGNLFSLALAYPQASFLGIDFSQEQITLAQQHQQALNLGNIEFRQQDILNFPLPEHQGKFDYIICHGVFSWVPEPVREKILALCRECLSPQGIALVSYNTLPGWNAVRSLRDMMLYHTSRFAQPAEKIRQARALLDFLAENVAENNKGYRSVIEDERRLLKDLNDTYLYHDHLEGVNAQFYFHEFAKLAQGQGLNYVGDANVPSMYVGNLPQKAMETLKAIDNVVSQEQYMDFITNRRFRSSILCKGTQKISRNLRGEQVLNYFLTFNPAVKVTGADPKQNITFKVNEGQFITHNEISGTLFLELAAAGIKPVVAKTLIARTQEKLGLKDAAPIRKALAESGLQLIFKGFLNLHSDSLPSAAEVSAKPVAFPLARHQAAARTCRTVTNILGQTLASSAAENIMLQHLDGSRTAEDIATTLTEQVQKGALEMAKGGVPVKDATEIRQNMLKVTTEALSRMAKHALLIN